MAGRLLADFVRDVNTEEPAPLGCRRCAVIQRDRLAGLDRVKPGVPPTACLSC